MSGLFSLFSGLFGQSSAESGASHAMGMANQAQQLTQQDEFARGMERLKENNLMHKVIQLVIDKMTEMVR